MIQMIDMRIFLVCLLQYPVGNNLMVLIKEQSGRSRKTHSI